MTKICIPGGRQHTTAWRQPRGLTQVQCSAAWALKVDGVTVHAGAAGREAAPCMARARTAEGVGAAALW